MAAPSQGLQRRLVDLAVLACYCDAAGADGQRLFAILFDSTTRTLFPPTLMRATWRTVWFSNTSGTPKGAGKSSAHRGAGVEAQVVIHPFIGADPSSANAATAVRATQAGGRGDCTSQISEH